MNSTTTRGPSVRTRIALVATIGLLGAGISPVMSASAAPAISTVAKLSAPSPKLSYEGALTVGSTVSVTLPKPSGVKVKYQWLRGGKKIAKAVRVPYTAVAADRGKTLQLKVTFSKKGQKTVSRTTAKTPKVGYGTIVGGESSISGALAVDNVVTASTSEWTPGTKVAYQWLADGVAIPKATSTTLAIPGSAVGKYLTIKVTGTKAGFRTKSYESPQTSTVTGGIIIPALLPLITGDAVVGGKLTLQQGTWSPTTAKLTYQWLRNGSPIAGATKTTYTVTAADAGTLVTARTLGSRSGYLSATTYTLPAIILGLPLP